MTQAQPQVEVPGNVSGEMNNAPVSDNSAETVVAISAERLAEIENGAEPTPEEEASLLKMGYVLEGEETETVYTDGETGQPLSADDVDKMLAGDDSGEGGKRRRRRRRKNRGGNASAQPSTSQSPSEKREPHRAIRRIEIAAPKEEVPPPSCTIGLGKFIYGIQSVARLAEVADAIIAQGKVPDVVVWERAGDGFDHVRIKVTPYDGEDREKRSKRMAHIEVTEATGQFAHLAKYVGKKLRFGEVKGMVESTPPHRAEATKALNEVFIAAEDRLAQAKAKREAREGSRKPATARA